MNAVYKPLFKERQPTALVEAVWVTVRSLPECRNKYLH
jgi:hypothetical protein